MVINRCKRWVWRWIRAFWNSHATIQVHSTNQIRGESISLLFYFTYLYLFQLTKELKAVWYQSNGRIFPCKDKNSNTLKRRWISSKLGWKQEKRKILLHVTLTSILKKLKLVYYASYKYWLEKHKITWKLAIRREISELQLSTIEPKQGLCDEFVLIQWLVAFRWSHAWNNDTWVKRTLFFSHQKWAYCSHIFYLERFNKCLLVK